MELSINSNLNVNDVREKLFLQQAKRYHWDSHTYII